MEGAAYVEFRGVRKSYDGETLVVRDLDLDVARGEFLTLLGPSGSGKTTLLMMLAGFEVPTAGDILIDGRSIAGLAPHERGLGVVFQSYALFPHMTVAENVAFPLGVRRVPKGERREKVARALEMVRLDGLDARRPGQLSGGQMQRVALARALVFEPALVLMDEPLGALDKQLREHMQLELMNLHRQLGLTVVYVTHDQSEALTMSDRVAVFDRGEVQQVAAPDVLYDAPDNAFVAQFVGENNRLPGTLRSIDGDRCVVEVDGCGDVSATPVRVGAVGEAVSLSLRPERVMLDPGVDVPNRFEASVEARVYHGDHTRLRLRLGHHDAFMVKLPNDAAHTPPPVGARLTVGWTARECRALDPLESA